MSHRTLRALRAAACLATPLLGGVALAQADPAPTGTSKPVAVLPADTIPAARDVAYPGTIRLVVDATDTARRIFRVTETIPVAAGPLTLLFPKWLPGNHSPSGEIDKLAGLIVTAGGKTLPWRRDPVDVTAFHIDVPASTTEIEARFQYLSPTDGSQGRVVMTPDMLNIQWNSVALYPAGFYTRGIAIQASAVYPAGWTSATALRPSGGATAGGGRVDYAPVSFDTLVDSPSFAGRYARIEELAPDVTLNLFADKPSALQIKPEQLALHRDFIVQARRLYGASHFDHYDFLYALTDRLGGIGLEHHRSSENSTSPALFTDWANTAPERDLLPHEMTHSWNGKFRRPVDLWTPDYRTPMRDSLLWVYEGQTQFWGNVLAARSGLVSQQDALDALAMDAAAYEYLPGRAWRPLVDTTNDPIIAQRAPEPWRSYQRSEDYYVEGQLIWLDADSIIRERSKGRRSLDDFARAFFGVRDRDWGELTYDFDEVVATLNRVEPYDWAGFLHARVDDVRPHAPLDGLARGGYKIVFTDEPSGYWKANEQLRKIVDLSYSLGLTLSEDGKVTRVVWDSPAFTAGLTTGATLVAIDGQAYASDDLKDAIKTAAKPSAGPIRLLVKQGSVYRTIEIAWTGGLRYPHLERTTKGPSSLDALYAPRKS